MIIRPILLLVLLSLGFDTESPYEISHSSDSYDSSDDSTSNCTDIRTRA